MNYGLPYQGNKSKIVNEILEFIPSAENFVDLFAGGCAVTHAALISGRWKKFIANDILGTPEAFLYAIKGGSRELHRIVTREEFNTIKEKTDPESILLRIIWSFSNDQRNFLYGKNVEKIRLVASEMIVSDDMKTRRLSYRKFVKLLNETGIPKRPDLESLESLERLESLESLERLESLESLESLERLESLEVHKKDYRQIEIPQNSVVYCDPPYIGKTGYKCEIFDNEVFFEWARNQEAPVFISEESAPSDFVKVFSMKKRRTFSALDNSKISEECLFVHESKLKSVRRPKLFY